VCNGQVTGDCRALVTTQTTALGVYREISQKEFGIECVKGSDMSKPKQRKSGSKSKKRIPARKVKPKCKKCRKILRMYAEIEVGYCQDCLTEPLNLAGETLLDRLKRGEE